MMFGREAEKLKSFLGSGAEFKGELKAGGILRMDGRVTGRIEADQVILSATALVKGDIVAKRIVVGGSVEGTLTAQELVEILPKGKVKGGIFTKKLLVMEGGELNGQIEMKADGPKVVEFESKGRDASSKC